MQNRVAIALCLMIFVSGCGQNQQDLSIKGNSNKQQQTAGSGSANAAPAQNAVAAESNPEAANESGFKPFLVYMDKGTRFNHYIPSGFMPDGKCILFNDTHSENCYEGKTCIKVEYQIPCSQDGAKWAGVYWLNPANNWGSQKGGFNLTGANQ